MLKLGLETRIPHKFSGITQFNAFKTSVSLCLCSPATKWEQCHCTPNKTYERDNPSMCTNTYSCDWESEKHYLQNELTHVPASRGYCCYLVVLFSFVFFLSLPQSTWSCWLLPRSSWARTAAAALLLEEFSQMPECQESRSCAWWFLPAAQPSLLPLFFKFQWLNPFFFSNMVLHWQSIRGVAKATSEWIEEPAIVSNVSFFYFHILMQCWNYKPQCAIAQLYQNGILID